MNYVFCVTAAEAEVAWWQSALASFNCDHVLFPNLTQIIPFLFSLKWFLFAGIISKWPAVLCHLVWRTRVSRRSEFSKSALEMTDHFPGHCAVTHLNVPCVKKQGNGIILTFPPKDDEKMVASDHYFDRSSISPLKSLWLKSKSCCNVHYWLRIMSCDDGRAFSFSGFPEEIKCLYYSLSASRPWQIRDGLHRTCMSNTRKHWRKFVKYSGSLSPLTDDPWHKQELREPTCPLRRCACFGKKRTSRPITEACECVLCGLSGPNVVCDREHLT